MELDLWHTTARITHKATKANGLEENSTGKGNASGGMVQSTKGNILMGRNKEKVSSFLHLEIIILVTGLTAICMG